MNGRRTLRAHRVPLKLAAPFRIFGHEFQHVDVIRVEVSESGFRGRGEAAGVYYLDEHPDQMLARIETIRSDIEAGISRAELRHRLPAGGARNAIDCALWELEARRADTTVGELIGLSSLRPLPTTVTLGADDPVVMRTKAIGYADFHAFKLKLTGDAELDSARIGAVRDARPEAWLGVDANQAYGVASIQGLMPALVETGVALLEQPFARGREADMDGIDRTIPIAADESVQDLGELEAHAGRFDVVNIKLDKCGGLTEGLLMLERARQLGLKAMVGCMVGSSLATMPGFLLGQQCDIVDLDNALFLEKDHAPGVKYERGQVYGSREVWG